MDMKMLFIIGAGVVIFNCGIMAERYKDFVYELQPKAIRKKRKVAI
nr:unnamed protein product [uncultured bacterium]